MKAIANWILKQFISGEQYTYAEIAHRLNVKLYEREKKFIESGLDRKQFYDMKRSLKY